MSWPVRIVRYIIAFVIAFLVTYVLAATFYTVLVNAELASLDHVEVPLDAYVTGAWDNIVGLTSSAFGNFFGTYAGVILVALLIAYPVALGVKAVLKPLAPLAYPIAGAAAVGVALYLIGWSLGLPAMAGAREPAGFILQMVAGLVGGIVFALVRPVTAPEAA